MFYLIVKGKVVQKSDKVFPVAREFKWIESKEDYPYGTVYLDGKFTLAERRSITWESDPSLKETVDALYTYIKHKDSSLLDEIEARKNVNSKEKING